jgi:WhiB family redox-sensing transcriptional regulator
MKLGRWIQEAACKGQTELFYPRQGDNSSFAKAAQICSTCPVLIECDEYAMTNYERFGIWAGMNEKKRRVARRMSQPTETMTSN